MSAQHTILLVLLAGGLQGCTIENWFDDPDEDVVPAIWITETSFQTPSPQVDVLWVVDNTQSMTLEHEALADSYASFVETLDEEGLAYQIGVVTTDMEVDGGVLRGNPWIITPGLEEGADAFAQAIDVGGESLAQEAGLAAMVTALSEPLRSGANRGFRRDTAALHVIVVSDSNDHSEDWLEGNPLKLADDVLQAEADQSLLPALFSAVVGPSPNGCSGPSGTATPGPRYLELVNRRNGAFASICDSDFGQVISTFGSLSVVFPRLFPIENEAVEESLRVSVDDQIVEDWTYVESPTAVLFDQAPPADSKIEIRYRLFQETSP